MVINLIGRKFLPQVGANQANFYLPMVVPIIVLSAILAFELFAIYRLNGGIFVYPLDDAYIHLALAENLAKGHYGVNVVERSAPSSSILWPFLLAPFAKLAFYHFVPLILNSLVSVGTLFVFHGILGSALAGLDRRQKQLLTGIMIVLLILATNLVGLALTGMEHSLQLFLSSLLVFGLVRERETRKVAWWLLAAVVLGPLVRYENFALSIPALGYLAWRGHLVSSLVSGLLLTLAAGAFSLWLYSMDLGLVPTSVIAKSSVVESSFGIGDILNNARSNLRERQGLLLVLGLLILVPAVLNRRRDWGDRLIAGWAVIAAALHLAVGDFGWLSRYEIYAWAAVLLTLIYVYRKGLINLIEALQVGRVALVLTLATIILSIPYGRTLFSIPFEARNVYEINYQLHRFVTEYYPAPVAASELGWLSYQNEQHVLDFGGLASKEALTFLKGEPGVEWMNELAAQHDVKLALIFPSWSPVLPANWSAVAELQLRRGRFARREKTLTFYTLEPEAAGDLKLALLDFRDMLPASVKLVLVE